METNEDQKSSPPLTLGQYGSQGHLKSMAQYITRAEVIKEQQEKINALPMSKRWPFEAADTYLPLYGGIAGLICHSFLRRMLMVHRLALLTGGPMVLLPGLSVKFGWYAFITEPVLAGELNCALCGEMRGGMVNVALGALYPMIVGIPIMSIVAGRHHTVDMPPLKSAFTNWPKFSQFWTRKLRFFKGQFVTLILFQIVIGTIVAKKQMDVCEKELKMKYAKVEVADD